MPLSPKDFRQTDEFHRRHIGPSDADVSAMVAALGLDSVETLIDQTVPSAIRLGRELDLPEARSEHGMLAEFREIAGRNRMLKSYLGMGYSDTITPGVILRNILENPGWYT
jgi:glycine dehydrogenase